MPAESVIGGAGIVDRAGGGAVPGDRPDARQPGRMTRGQILGRIGSELLAGLGLALFGVLANRILFPDGEMFSKLRGRLCTWLFGWGRGVGVARFVVLSSPRSIRIGPYTRIQRDAVLKGPLVIGEYCWIGERNVIYPQAELGDRIALGPNVMIVTQWHPIGQPNRRTAPVMTRPIRIGDGCTVNGGAMILAGCTIGDGAVVLGGAKVSRSVPAHTVVAGDPARVVRRLEPGS